MHYLPIPQIDRNHIVKYINFVAEKIMVCCNHGTFCALYQKIRILRITCPGTFESCLPSVYIPRELSSGK